MHFRCAADIHFYYRFVFEVVEISPYLEFRLEKENECFFLFQFDNTLVISDFHRSLQADINLSPTGSGLTGNLSRLPELSLSFFSFMLTQLQNTGSLQFTYSRCNLYLIHSCSKMKILPERSKMNVKDKREPGILETTRLILYR